MRFGLRWKATLYVGQILTAGRAGVTALGDEVNECARGGVRCRGPRARGSTLPLG